MMNRLLLVCLMLCLFANFKAYGQTVPCDAISCNDRIQISMDSCAIKVLPDMLHEGGSPGTTYRVEIFDKYDNPLNDTITVEHAGQVLKYQIFNDCGNSCWGEVLPELNIVYPQVTAPCEYVPSLMADEQFTLSTTNNMETLTFEVYQDCELMLDIEINSDLSFDGSNGAGTIWKPAEASYSLLDASGNLVNIDGVPITGQTVDGTAYISITLPSVGRYSLMVQGQDDSTFGTMNVKIETSQCNRSEMCTVWCASAEPYDFITLEELKDSIDASCSIPLLEDIQVQEEISGDMCDPEGQIRVITYLSKANIHGKKQTVVLLRQAYVVEPLDIFTTGTVSSTIRVIPPAPMVKLDCFANPHPDSIAASTGSDSLAYPQFVDPHTLVDNVRIIERDTHYTDTTGVRVKKMVKIDVVDPNTGQVNKVWTLVDVIEHVQRDSVIIDTIITRVGEPGYVEERPKIRLEKNTCNVNTYFTDQIFDACNGGTKVLRTWKSIDWCGSNMSREWSQTIEIIDRTPPEVIGTDTLPIHVDPWTCEGRLDIPDLVITDDCTAPEDITVRYESTQGIIKDGVLENVPNIDELINVTVIVGDACGNETRVELFARVFDNTQPVAVCSDVVEVSLTYDPTITGDGNGSGKIFAEAFDQGSHDGNCGDVTVQVIRMEDTEEFVYDCDGNILGYLPKTCDPVTKMVKACGDEDEEEFEVAVPGDYVKFCCEDSNNDSLRVIVIVTDESGNENRCMVEAKARNKAFPFINCETVEVECTLDYEGLATPALIGGVCAGSYDLKLLDEVDVEGRCGIDSLSRRWYIDLNRDNELDSGEPNCEQTVIVSNSSKALDPYKIKWPKHFDGRVVTGINIECETDSTASNIEVDVPMGDFFTCTAGTQELEPAFCTNICGLVATSVESDTLIASDACLKIINRWKVIDWCTYEANGPNVDDENDQEGDSFIAVTDWAQGECIEDCPDGAPVYPDNVYFRYTDVDQDGYYTYDQIIKIVDDSAPEILVDADTVIVALSGGNQTKDDDIPCFGSDIVTATASDLCGGEMSPSEFIRWEASIFDENDEPVLNTAGEYQHRGVGSTFSISTRNGELGDLYTIRWTARDGCGNVTTKRTFVSFTGDPKPPTALCITNISSQAMDENGTAVIWANDFDAGSFDNCTSPSDLHFTIVPTDSIPLGLGDPGFEEQSGITVTCEDLTDRFETFDVYITDESGNQEYCTVTLFISDGCDFDDNSTAIGTAAIAGEVRTPMGVPLDDVQIVRESASGSKEVNTDATGAYSFASNPMNQSYILEATKASDEGGLVSTLDILFIQKYILGLEEFESHYQLLASDVNHDEKISSIDLVQIRKNILGLKSSLDSNPWMFIKEDDSANIDMKDPWSQISEAIEISKLQNDMLNGNFIGIKLGDINGNRTSEDIEERSVFDPVVFTLKDQTVEANEIITVDVTAKNFNDIYGYQFALEMKGLEFINLSSSTLAMDQNNVSVKSDVILVSWSDAYEHTMADEVVFSLTLRANETLRLKERLNLVNERLIAEAYRSESLSIVDLDLEIVEDVPQDFALLANSPNPWSDQTKIRMSINKTQQVNLSIYDATGKLVYTHDEVYEPGVHAHELKRSSLVSSGVYYCKMSGIESTVTRKILLID